MTNGSAELTRTPILSTQRRSECDCPVWVIRCAHWDGGVMTVRDYAHPEYVAYYGDEDANEARFELFGFWEAGACDYWQGYLGDDHEAALEAFYVAERELLGGAS